MNRIPTDREEDKRILRALDGTSEGGDPDPDRVFWRQFAEASTQKNFCRSWLFLQCRYLKGVRCAMVLLGPPNEGPFTPIAFWPDAKLNMTHLTGAVERALKERRGLLLDGASNSQFPNAEPDTYHVSYPIEVAGNIHGVVVLEVSRHPKHEVQAILRQIHWGAAWLEVMIRRTDALKSEDIIARFQQILDSLTSLLEHEGFQETGMGFVTKLSTLFKCDRVSLGFLKGGDVRVALLSHSAEFGKQTNLIRAIGAAMDEAVDQNAVILYPPQTDSIPLVTRAHEELARQHGAGVILTIPLEHNGELFGALTFERPADNLFSKFSVEACESAAALSGPILKVMRSEERWLILKIADSSATQLKRLLGPGHLIRKLVFLAFLAVVFFFSVAKVDYKVTAKTHIEGAVQRVVAAPFDSYVKEAPIRPGDVVQKGDVICLLEDRELLLERLGWLKEKEQLIKQYQEAMAKYDRAQYRIIKAKIDQADAQIALLEEQLARTKILAPFDGVVMSGDLSQSLGAPVERGQVLFEVAPLEQYRVIAEVDERDITEIAVGQESELLLSSMPNEVSAFVISSITPVSTAREGRNYFRVEGQLLNVSPRLRPGMEGIGKIRIDRRKLIWMWTHEMIDWLRLQIWRWRP
ncbi:MAG: HlyD family efflux transporter periplasmic adaptor subunit [Deltaproteobacteria bacterium]|nr:HlyD family efflux transporter periplasmic adaptor subunit [Deltaproteobacteria bacterium]